MNFNLSFIKKRRTELDIPMQQMAIYLGFKNASTYLKYERGDYSFKAEQLPTLAKVLKCDVSDFFNLSVA
ncbi:helix-turn-helix transcriptional regulator [Bacillus sp. IITD106]|nr:helix-turn-helix transcriptional regulator [Bacillus sp. IITD106]